MYLLFIMQQYYNNTTGNAEQVFKKNNYTYRVLAMWNRKFTPQCRPHRSIEHREEEKLICYRSLLGAAADNPTTLERSWFGTHHTPDEWRVARSRMTAGGEWPVGNCVTEKNYSHTLYRKGPRNYWECWMFSVFHVFFTILILFSHQYSCMLKYRQTSVLFQKFFRNARSLSKLNMDIISSGEILRAALDGKKPSWSNKIVVIAGRL